MSRSDSGTVREFPTGATRDGDADKPDYEGFLSPPVVRRYGQYMHKHRKQSDGTLRAPDNWQQGIPADQYMKSDWRHLIDVWTLHRCYPCVDEKGEPVNIEEALCAILFNTSGYLHELLKLKEKKSQPEEKGADKPPF